MRGMTGFSNLYAQIEGSKGARAGEQAPQQHGCIEQRQKEGDGFLYSSGVVGARQERGDGVLDAVVLSEQEHRKEGLHGILPAGVLSPGWT